MADIILFTDAGERVPFYHDVEETDEKGVTRIPKHGWREPHAPWKPGYMAAKVRKGWRVFALDRDIEPVRGSVYQLRAWDWWRGSAGHHRRFPTAASLEMFMRHCHAIVK